MFAFILLLATAFLPDTENKHPNSDLSQALPPARIIRILIPALQMQTQCICIWSPKDHSPHNALKMQATAQALKSSSLTFHHTFVSCVGFNQNVLWVKYSTIWAFRIQFKPVSQTLKRQPGIEVGIRGWTPMKGANAVVWTMSKQKLFTSSGSWSLQAEDDNFDQ